MKLQDLLEKVLFTIIFLGLSLTVFACSNFAQNNPTNDGKIRVLFIGNSLTYANNLPEIIANLARSRKQKFSYKMIAYPNFSLEDHWNKGEVQKALAKEKWDFVVMQQGPSASQEGKEVLLEYAKKFAPEIAKAGAKPALYMVWSSAERIRDFGGVQANYLLAATEVNGLFFPAGEAWLETWKRDPKIELYSADRFHPSLLGSYLAALVIYQQLYKESPLGLTRKIRFSVEEGFEIPEKQAQILQEAAAETNKKYGFN